MKRGLLHGTLAAALMLGGAGGALAAASTPLKVVASFTILANMVQDVGGDKVEVRSLVGPNGDPHTFEPTPKDAEELKAADLVFVNGLGLEGWMNRLISASGYKGKPVVASDGIKVLKLDEDGKTVDDPHAWNAAMNGVVYIERIEAALVAADPKDASYFKARAQETEQKLTELDRDAKREIGAIPQGRRKILTTHDALGYFSKAYDVEILSPLGISTEQEPSAKAVADLIKLIRAEHIRTYFLENSNDPRLIEQIARATKAKVGGELYVESLSKPDGPAPTYLAMFKHNLDLIVAAMREKSS